ncbi:MAG: histidinol dehydrogenase [Planctomycetota bacterium]|nr:histidinol dehydrogenase [Planctomycetota bacterium]
MRAGGLSAIGDADRVNVRKTVREIIDDVKERGDQAVIDLTAKIEKVNLTAGGMRVSSAEIAAAHAAADPAFLQLVRRVRDNIQEYQNNIIWKDPAPLHRGGRTLSVRYTPMDRVGVYVPGGKAAYPSTVLMTIVPAQVAGVKEIAVVSPPTGGKVNPLVLATLGELGVQEVYGVSGTAGLIGMALGTKSIPAVDKIVGPGNAFIAEAKRQLFGQVGIDSVAGPSEVLIIADDTANPAWLAADMLAQAEHNPGSAILVTWSRSLAGAVKGEIDKQLARLDRADAAAHGLSNYSAIFVKPNLTNACMFANTFAPEHLQIITADNQAVLSQIRHAGAIFLGPHTPVPVGDYYAGPSHVLPTGGTARFFGPLSCNDFLKASSVVEYDEASLAADAADIIDFATREGLTAHANAVRIRQRKS